MSREWELPMNNERNPITDPMPGDIVRATIYKNGRERHVAGRAHGRLTYYAVSPTRRDILGCSIQAWRRWCEYAKVEIIQRGV